MTDNNMSKASAPQEPLLDPVQALLAAAAGPPPVPVVNAAIENEVDPAQALLAAAPVLPQLPALLAAFPVLPQPPALLAAAPVLPPLPALLAAAPVLPQLPALLAAAPVLPQPPALLAAAQVPPQPPVVNAAIANEVGVEEVGSQSTQKRINYNFHGSTGNIKYKLAMAHLEANPNDSYRDALSVAGFVFVNDNGGSQHTIFDKDGVSMRTRCCRLAQLTGEKKRKKRKADLVATLMNNAAPVPPPVPVVNQAIENEVDPVQALLAAAPVPPPVPVVNAAIANEVDPAQALLAAAPVPPPVPVVNAAIANEGNLVDPRILTAAQVHQMNSSMSFLEALIHGGFFFYSEGNRILDSDNVPLSQRENELIRHLFGANVQMPQQAAL